MKISNIITLVKAGYTPAEISAMDRAEDVVQMLTEGISKEDIPALLELSVDVPELPPEPEPAKPKEEKEEPSVDPVDYKKKYEELLKQTQKANTRGNIADEMPNNDEVIKDIVRSFM